MWPLLLDWQFGDHSDMSNVFSPQCWTCCNLVTWLISAILPARRGKKIPIEGETDFPNFHNIVVNNNVSFAIRLCRRLEWSVFCIERVYATPTVAVNSTFFFFISGVVLPPGFHCLFIYLISPLIHCVSYIDCALGLLCTSFYIMHWVCNVVIVYFGRKQCFKNLCRWRQL